LPPPGRFSTITGWPIRMESCSATKRAMMSVPLPAACEVIKRTGRSGQVWASAATAMATPATAHARNARIAAAIACPFVQFAVMLPPQIRQQA